MKKATIIYSFFLFLFCFTSSHLAAQEEPYVEIGDLSYKPAVRKLDCDKTWTSGYSISFGSYCSDSLDTDVATQDYIKNRLEKKLKRLVKCNACEESDEKCHVYFIKFTVGSGIPTPTMGTGDCSGNYFAATSGKVKLGCSTCSVNGLLGTNSDISMYTGFGDDIPDALPSENKGVLSVYPNPAEDYIDIDFKLNKDSELNDIIIFDLTGKAVQQKSLSEFVAGSYSETLDISNLNPGIYFVSFYDENGKIDTVRFVVN